MSNEEKLMSQIPPLNSLRVFECVAQHGNFTKAGDELHITQSAISRQISNLESFYQVKLFNRERVGVKLTPQGKALFEEVTKALDLIRASSEKILRPTAGQNIKIRTYTTFIAKWLIQRIPQFQEQHPHIEILLSGGLQPEDFEEETDYSIQFGSANETWSGNTNWFLFNDEIDAVCSPQLLEQIPLNSISDLSQHKLLHSKYRKDDWSDWIKQFNRTDLIGQCKEMVFSSSLLNYQAAVDGLGVAIGQIHLLQNELNKGLLVTPFNKAVKREFGYYLVKHSKRTDANFKLFKEWLFNEIKQMQRQ
jgi:LysR family glycine cleavage system transcriptional activator